MFVVPIVLLMLMAIAALAFVWHESRESRRVLQAQLDTQAATFAQTLATMQTSLQNQMQAVDLRITSGVDGVRQSLSTSLTSTHDTMRNVDQQLGKLSESTRQMLDVGRDISGLQQMLRAPKPRGQFGELLLERLLADVLPESNFALQHRFRNGTIVDAAVMIGGGCVPIDSKFPASAFQRILDAQDDAARALARRDFTRDVRIHVDAVAKYILPDENKFAFALMYIPAENIYYETMIRDGGIDLQQYMHQRHVMACSPNTFFGYLEAIVLGLKGMRVEERSREILGHLERLNADFAGFRGEFETLGHHLSRAKSKYDDIDRSSIRFAARLSAPLQHEWTETLAGDDPVPLRLIP